LQCWRFIEYGCYERRLGFSRSRLELERLSGLGCGRRCWFGVAAAHQISVETLLDYGTGAGFHNGLTRNIHGALSTFVEFAFNAFRLLRRDQA
jgi:hypothetical protein